MALLRNTVVQLSDGGGGRRSTPEETQKIINDEPDAANLNKNKLCWMRNIEVVLTSRKTKQSMIFKTTGRDSYNIDIVGTKYLALNKDKGTLTISNLEYDKMMEIILLEYYIIEIKAGYVSIGDLPTIFKGEVSFISQKIHSHHDVDTYITFASSLVARYSQSRMNFNFNSGVNIYAALNYICKISGIGRNVKIDPQLRKLFLQNVYNNYANASTVFDNMTSTSGSYTLSCDESEGNVIDCTTIYDKRKITIDPNTINIANGNPTVTSAGLSISLLPTFNFMPGDILVIDNAILNTSIRDADSVYKEFNTNYLDQNGEYMIIEINFRFQNRGAVFTMDITARALDIIKKIQGLSEPAAIIRKEGQIKQTTSGGRPAMGAGAIRNTIK